VSSHFLESGFSERQIFDISPVISAETAVFPGDTPFSQDFLLKIQDGKNLDLSTIRSTVHIGAHTDAPSHYHGAGQTMEARSLHYYVGAVQVITVPTNMGNRIQVKDLKSEIKAPRVLFKTKSFPNPNNWNSDFMALSSGLIDFLAEQRVMLVGIDTPSVDLADDPVLESHSAIYRHNMAILEGIVLDAVTDGIYDLVCLPLKIKGSDASPVRAILLK
jgi:arylformamidase